MKQTVLVVGASPKPDRYSHRAVVMLAEYGHTVIPVHPLAETIAGIPAVSALAAVTERPDTVSIYVRPERLRPMLPDLIALKPGRVIFSPGTEDAEIAAELERVGISVLDACTLVMLRTGQF
ncbi:MAG TPA: CoA-binding protein [bacterium]|nr:CoA-binding protein [bacterium]HPQ67321.1 CoA-binding protein [bacterium]